MDTSPPKSPEAQPIAPASKPYETRTGIPPIILVYPPPIDPEEFKTRINEEELEKRLPGDFKDAEADKSSECQIFVVEATEFDRITKGEDVFALYALPIPDEDKELSPILPTKYAEFKDLFDKEKADILPEHRPYDCPIDLEGDQKPPFGPIYSLSQPELLALKDYIEENLAKGFIQHSKSPAGAPILFVKKKDGSLRLCVDYRGLNRITVRNRYPLPLISQLLDQLAEAKVFTKIDLRGAYNLVRIRKGDEWKTAFRTRYGHFEYNVMPFGLTNAPAVFQHLMNDVFREFLDQFVVIYLDDVLIFSKTQEEHEKHVRLVLEKLKTAGLYAKLEKCEFDKDSVEFLGYVISQKGISMDRHKVDTLLCWAQPQSLREVQCFLGFANFYRSFIKNYSKVASPLIALTRKDRPFAWNERAENSFEELKRMFTTAPILAHADPAKAFVVETDGSDFALGAVLSQEQSDGKLHPVAFYSRKFIPAEINYEIYDKELLAIVASFEQWRNYLYGAKHKVVVYTDHKNLLYYTTTRRLNRRQARWSLFLADFDFTITYRPGAKQGKPDALSRRPEYHLKEGDDAVTQQHAVILKPGMVELNAISALCEDEKLIKSIMEGLKTDKLVSKLAEQTRSSPNETNEYTKEDGLILRKGLVYVPDNASRLKVLYSRHDNLLAGHFGVKKTTELVKRNYWWPGLGKTVEDYVKSCDTCARAKPPHHKPHGLLHPLDIPNGPWQSVSMDFITGLPVSRGFDAILVVVDRLTKMSHFIACHTTVTADQTAQLYINNVVRLHGLPMDIVSDRGPQFTSKFWRSLLNTMEIKCNLSSAFHPQTDGQTERVNQILEQYLRCTINHLQTNWVDLLPLAEFAYNNSTHTSTQQTPFFSNLGYHPRFDLTAPIGSNNPAAKDLVERLAEIHQQLKIQLAIAQQTYKQFADNKRQEAPHFNIGDRVWLLRKNIRTTRPTEKLDHKRIGPYEIIERINEVAYRLELPSSMKIHNVFHVSLLEPYNINPFPGRLVPAPPPVEVDNVLEYEVEEIMDSKRSRRKLYYLVHWKGFDVQERTWEPVENLTNARELIKEFHTKYANQPKKERKHPLRKR